MLNLNLWLQEVERVRWDEQRKTMQQDAQTKAELSKYDDQLARYDHPWFCCLISQLLNIQVIGRRVGGRGGGCCQLKTMALHCTMFEKAIAHKYSSSGNVFNYALLVFIAVSLAPDIVTGGEIVHDGLPPPFPPAMHSA